MNLEPLRTFPAHESPGLEAVCLFVYRCVLPIEGTVGWAWSGALDLTLKGPESLGDLKRWMKSNQGNVYWCSETSGEGVALRKGL